MLKKLLLSILASLVLFFNVSVPFAKAQGVWYDQSFKEWYVKVYDQDLSPASEIFGERYTAAQVQWILYSFLAFHLNFIPGGAIMTCILTGDMGDCWDAVSPFSYDSEEGPQYAENTVQKSLLSMMFEERDFSGIRYVKDKFRKFHIIPEAQAQEGFGFGALGPLQDLWKGARDIAYSVFVLVIIFFAFAIMFRLRLFSPQAAVTIQVAIPRVVISLILVTFSYAIAGFLIDLMYVATGILSMLFAIGFSGLDPIPGNSAAVIYNFMVGRAEIGIFCPGGPGCVTASVPGGIIAYLIWYIFIFVLALLIIFFQLMFTNLVNFFLSPFVFAGLVVVCLIGLIAVLIAIFKIIWMLVKVVANIYLLVIFGPIIITVGTVMNSFGFSAWVKKLIQNLAVFPAAGGVIYLAYFFLHLGLVSGLEGLATGNFAADVVDWITHAVGIELNIGGGWAPPLLGAGSEIIPLMYVMISLVLVLLIPKLDSVIASAMQGRPFGYGAAIGEAVGFARSSAYYARDAAVGTARDATFGAAKGYAQQAWQRLRPPSSGATVPPGTKMKT